MTAANLIRLNRLLGADGRTVIAALDHGIAGLTPLAALEQPAALLEQVVAAGVDAIITTPGLARTFSGLWRRTGLIVRVDAGPSTLTGRWAENRLAVSVEDALALGADAVIAMGIVGAEGESESLQGLARLAGTCQRWGLPLVAEMLPLGLTAPTCTHEQIAIAARLGAELGANLVKIRYAGPPEAFRAVTAGCFCPVVVLGGSKQSPDELLGQTRDALQAGAVGVAVGRNIWQHPQPGEMARALVAQVHG